MQIKIKKHIKLFFSVLSKKEKLIFLAFLFTFLISFSIFLGNFYLSHTKIIPAYGGSFTEGVIGTPRYINPIYSELNDPDRDLVELLFAGLMKYNSEGEIVPDLAKKYEIKDEGKTYIFYLKENAVWSDKKPITADDVIFTIKTIQNPDYQSPLRPQWIGIDVEKISDYTVKFSLSKPYSGFLEQTTLKIIPKHIFQNISPQGFPLTAFNLQPITSGPYKFKDIKLDKLGFIESYTIERNENYFGEKPYIKKIIFLFFNNKKDLLESGISKKIDSLFLSSAASLDKKDEEKLSSFKEYNIPSLRYFAIFFNPEKSKILSDEDIRRALNYATDKKEIISKLLNNRGEALNSLFPNSFLGSNDEITYDPEKAKEIFRKKGFEEENGFLVKVNSSENKDALTRDLTIKSKGDDVRRLQECLAKFPDIYPEGEVTGYFGSKTKKAVIRFQEKYKDDVLKPLGLSKGTGKVGPLTREKINEICFPSKEEKEHLSFNLITVDEEEMEKLANLLKEQWKRIGVDLKVQFVPLTTLERDYIKERNYEMILFGESLGLIPDPFPFWHSTQKKYPGLNLSLYQSKEADNILEEIRKTDDKEKRMELYKELNDTLKKDLPAIFLYSPNYLYFVNKKMEGISLKIIRDPSKRFCDTSNWFLKTKRVLKK